jgi:hypothetical protein
MFGILPDIGISAFWVLVTAGSAALLLIICVVSWLRRSGVAANPVLRVGFLMIGMGLGTAMTSAFLIRTGVADRIMGVGLSGAMTWASFLDRPGVADRMIERRALELRALNLNARALAPGSPLACLDPIAGESVTAACERALFASAASVAAASSYAAAQLALLSDMVASGGTDMETALWPLRRSLEADPFGFVAHVLVTRDGCTTDDCKALTLLHDASRVRANLSAEAFDRYLDHYLAFWAKAPDGTAGDPTQPAAGPQGPRKVGVNADFPSAASIPAVSIMNPEPTGPVPPRAAAAAAPSSRRSRVQITAPASQTGVPQAVEPIWPEPVPPPAPSNANAGTNIRSQ